MSEPDTPHPSQQDHNPGPPPIIVSQRVSCIVMSKHNRNHCPIRINHPVTRLDLADDPEEDIDVEEEESIG
uniref:Uncharacterized protein n=1 Tax=Lotus japonicus TaxID=34305 RepID=I3SK23_LOTJA|nr:unknown [Lotus japonicus]